jgi:outer membrane PBP1 activator LpoA protein
MNSTSLCALLTIFLLSAVGGNMASIHAAEKQDIPVPTVEEFLNDAPESQNLAYEKDNALLEKAAAMQIAIDKFKHMGVGVSMFEHSLQHARILIAEGKTAEANEALGHLNESLADQQKRFYADKIQSWHSDRARMIANKIAVKNGQIPYSAASDLSRSAHRTLSKKAVSGSPLLYPIAR